MQGLKNILPDLYREEYKWNRKIHIIFIKYSQKRNILKRFL
jgi:hypothetical protein